MKFKLAVIISHPVQYYSPIFQKLASNPMIDLKVYYTEGKSDAERFDVEFSQQVQWDIPLLEGYSYEFCRNISPIRGNQGFFGIIGFDLFRKLKIHQPDFVVMYGYNYFTHLSLLLFSSYRIILRGDSTNLDRLQGNVSSIKRFLQKQIFKKFFAGFYVGHQNRNYLTSLGLINNIHYVPHTIDQEQWISRAKMAPQNIKQINLRKQSFVLGFVGKLIPKKNPEILIRLVAEKFPEVELLVIGSGELEHRLKEEYSHARNIHFVGFVNQGAMATYYEMMHALVLPSDGPNETWGFTVNEAMALAKPCIISSKVGCQGDLVIDGHNGYVFEVGNSESLEACIRKMLDPENYNILQANTIELSKKFDDVVQINQMLEFFKYHS